MLAGIILSVVLSTTITTGDSYSKSTVINEVEGKGSVYTRIEVEANGEKEVLESSQSGKYEVEVKSSGSSGTSGATVKSRVSTTAESTPASQVSDRASISEKIRNVMENFLKMISKIFRFGS